jgi:hypothetical protein
MKRLQLAIIAAILVLAVQARASLYDITFTDGGANVANGQIDVVGGVAISGYLNVTAGLALGSDYSLFTWIGGGIKSVRITGTDLIVDNLVNVGASPFFDVYGLAFVNGDLSEGLDLSLNGSSDNLWGVGYTGYGIPNANGSVTLTPVPEPTTMVAGAMLLLPFGFSTLRILRKRQTA